MTYGIKLQNSSGQTTFDPSLDSPMYFVGSYTVPSYTAPGSTSVNIPGFRNDGHWFAIGGLNPLNLSTYTYTQDDTFISSTPTGSGTVNSSIVYIYRNNLTTPPNSGYGFWMKNDNGFVSSKTDSINYIMYGNPFVRNNGDLINVTVPTGMQLCGRPVNNSGSVYSGYDLSTAGKIYNTSGGQIELIIVGLASNLTSLSSGYGIQLFYSDGSLSYTSEYKSITAANNIRVSSSQTTWSISTSKPFYVPLSYRRSGIEYISGLTGKWTARAPNWTSSTSGSINTVYVGSGAPPINTTTAINDQFIMFQF